MDYYNRLGIPKNATQEEIKKAYRKLASAHHPDKGGDTKTFQEIEEAYRILSDEQKRSEYDNPNPFNRPNNFQQGFGMFTETGNPFDLFQEIFRRQGQQQQTYRTLVSLSLQDAYLGKELPLQIQTNNTSKVVSIKCPRGVDTGHRLRFDNIIENGIIVVEFKVEPDLKYDRKNDDLYTNVPVSVLDLITGTKIQFMTIGKKTFEVVIPPKTQPFLQLKIPGQGMPKVNTNQFGDQILVLKPFMPDKIDNAIIDAILKFK